MNGGCRRRPNVCPWDLETSCHGWSCGPGCAIALSTSRCTCSLLISTTRILASRRWRSCVKNALAPFTGQGLPAIFMGDFNTDQKRGDYPRLTSRGWQDTYKVSAEASEGGRDDNVSTTLDGARIDHIFYYGGALSPVSWRRLESPDAATPLSDHYPVLARLRWN